MEKVAPLNAEQLALRGVEHLLPIEGAPLEGDSGGTIEAFGVNIVKDSDDGKLK